MQMIPVSSSNLRAVGYDEASRTLVINFHHGGSYSYSGVPKSVFDGLLSAGSKGSYHASHIKHSFPYQRIC